MHRSITTTLLATTLLAAGSALADVVETRMLDETVPVTSAAPRVVVRNVFGPIRVTAHDRQSVEMTATETTRAETQFDLDKARAEVGLRTERGSDEVAFRVRHVDDSGGSFFDCRCNRWDGYVVAYEIELRVPRGAVLDLSTVNDGDIVVEGVQGDFEVSNVNGAVELAGLRGSGSASTVNGRLDVSFERAPPRETSFKTVNGRIDVAFPADLSADLAFKTFHGEIWTDFPAEAVASVPTTERARDRNMSVIVSNRRSTVRVAGGGPTHSFETLNGDIYVVEASR
jgi:DUF4097 and DUF4098 domain-containing protein YvlB